MLFNSLSFILFLPVVLLMYYALRSVLRYQNILLLVASFVFYAFWDWRFLSLIILSILVDYYCGLKMESQEVDSRRKYLSLSLFVNLGVLALFKYFDFFSESFSALMGFFGIEIASHTLGLILPLGISFYTFQTLAYTIDVYRGKIGAERDLLNFALYVSFFPQLVAGPIERAQNLLPQINSPRRISKEDFFKACWLIYFGFFLKIFLADNLALIVDEVFSKEVFTQASSILGAYAFAFQIYGDFAGYTFIAIGVAKLMGFNLMTNFLFPYFVTNPSDFWKNWHISLSSWLKDYLYIPLGGNRISRIITLRNLFITMVLGGLWHGAAWNFVLWGVFHALILVLFKWYSDRRGHGTNKKEGVLFWIKVILFFQISCIAWLLFRAESIAQIGAIFSSMLEFQSWTPDEFNYAKQILFYSAIPVTVMYFQFRTGSGNYIHSFNPYARVILYVLMFYAIMSFGEFGAKEFIYFQF